MAGRGLSENRKEKWVGRVCVHVSHRRGGGRTGVQGRE